MKRKISEYCIGKLLEYNEITDAEIDLYAYGIESVITIAINWSITLFLGIIFKQLIPTLIFSIIYIPLRSFAGGYHAKTEGRCFLYSLTLIVICEIVIKSSLSRNFHVWMVLFLVSIIIIYVWAPIEAESKPIFSEDSNKFRKIIFKIVIFSTLLLLIFIRKKKYIWCQSVFLAFVIEGLLLMIERKRRNTLVSYKKHILDFK